jgi:hypothetical protein
MLGVVPDIGASVLRLWVAAGSAALLVMVCALAFGWTRTRSAARASVVVLGAILGASMAWAFLDAATVRDQSAERRALEMRAAKLTAQALAPGSALACLDALAGESVETACEKALFAAPATVATATSYAAARLALLADMVAYTGHGGPNIDSMLLPLRRSLEADRFGFVAHALAVRDGCSSQSCKALTLLHDSSRVRANLSGETLDRYLDHYLTVWNQAPDTPVADLISSPPGAMGSPGGRKVSVNIDFPTASSIPPVSIMNPEPNRPVPGAAAAEPNPAPSPASKRSRKQAASAPAQSTPPPPGDSTSQVDPVWTPATAVAAPKAATAAVPGATIAAPGGGTPVQLNPFPAQPEASAGGAARTQ